MEPTFDSSAGGRCRRLEDEDSLRAACNGSWPAMLAIPDAKHCSGAPMVAVRYSTGGYMKKVCLSCYADVHLSYSDFEALPTVFRCPICAQMLQYNLIGKNYAVQCEDCRLYIWLADLVVDYTSVVPKGL
jgi:hypothetical protein